MAKEEIQIKIDAAVESANAAKSLGQLKKSLIEIQTLQAEIGETSGANFDKLSQASSAASAKLAETRDKIGDIQDKTRTLEGTPVERLTGSFGLLKESIMNLDFDKAKIGAEGLLNTFTPMVDGKLVTGVAGIKGAFSMLGDGIKTLGSTFMSVGKALLTNPIFLLAAAIVAIVAVVVIILDKLGLLKKIMDALMIPINLIIKGFQMLTDWLGLTTYALEDNAAAAKKNGETQRAEIDATANAQKNLLKLTEGMTEEEIGYFKKKAGIKDSLNQNSFDVEKTRLTQTNATLKNEINALEELKAAGGELTEDQQKDLEQRKKDYEANAAAIKQVELDKQKAIIDFNKKTTETLRDWQIKNIKDENERAKAQLQVTEAAELRKIDVEIANGNRLNQDVSKLKQARLEIVKYFDNEESKINEAVNKKNKETAKAQVDAANTAIGKKFKQLEDAAKLEIAQTKENTQARINAEKKAEDDLMAFRKNNLKALGISETQFATLKIEIDKAQKKRQEEFDTNRKTLDDKAKVAAAEIALLEATTADEIYATKKILVDRTAQMEMNAAKDNADEVEKIRLQSIQDQKALDEEYTIYQAEQLAITTQVIADKSAFELENHRYTKAEKALMDQQEVDKILKASSDQIVADMYAMEAELANTELTEAEKAEIKERYRELEIQREKDKEDKLRDLKLKNYNDTLELGQKANAAVQSLGDAIFAWKAKSAGKDLEQQKKNAQQQFKLNKAVQISTAIITGIQSVMSAFANGMKNPIPLLGPATAGVYAALAGIVAAANVAKISATTFDASSFTPATDTATPASAGAPAGGGAPTNFQPNQFFGLGQTMPTTGAGGTPPIKVYVSEVDITDTQERVRVIENRATLG